MKILKIIPSFYGGGGENLAVTLANKLHSEGNVVRVVSINGSADCCSKYKKIINRLDNNIEVIFLEKEKGIFKFLFNVFQLLVHIVGNRYNIFHSHLSGVFLLPILIVFSRAKKIHTIHSIPQAEARGKLKYYYKLLNTLGVKFVTISEQLKKESDNYLGFTTFKVVNGISALPSQRYLNLKSEHNIPDDHLVLIQIGRLYNEKNQIFTLKAFEKISKIFDNKITVIFIGEDPTTDQSYFNKIECEVKKMEPTIRNNVIFLGYKENVYEYLINSDIMLITSYYEGLPLVMLEAAQSNVCVISTDVGGIREVLSEDNGFLFNVDDYDEFYYIFNKINEMPSIVKNKADKLNQLFHLNFTDEVMYNNYIRLYHV
ncbi:glycosyltransferase family 4 protein [Vibrio alginolyticus]|uniref:glycosyltransferase family 4 protein n=1 Tax=Vibrio diabolicus TaxID=50719 RepID=UPI002940A14F|nr:glycosyltransferase family 4 protein [Vibrio diabolicus]MDV5085856.1 glycosyltransferase family 4 protein [Vibrio diabolicus]